MMHPHEGRIDILRVTSLRGPSLWTWDPVIEVLIDIGDLEDWPSDRIPGFPERLERWLPSLHEHRCSYGECGGFLRRLAEGTWPGHIVEHVALELLTMVGMRGGFGRTRGAPDRGIYKLVITSWDDTLSLAAIHRAIDLVLAAMAPDRPYDLEGALSELRAVRDRHWVGPSTEAIVHAARERGIPWMRLHEGNLIQLGHGAAQRRFWTGESDGTGAIASGIARDKQLTRTLLGACGVPVPEGRIAESPDDAWDAAQDIGLPVTVKPKDGNHGRGVLLDLRTEAEVRAAWTIAAAEERHVLVERFVPGVEHRLLVVGDRVVAATAGGPASIEGDGIATVRQLIARQLNSDPRRGETGDRPLNPVRVDAALELALRRDGLTPDSVVPAGTRVLVQHNGNLARDVTADVHPDVAARACLAARIAGLDIAGIDYVTDDIARAPEPGRSAIVSVNSGPRLNVHAPRDGTSVERSVVDHLFPPGTNGRIPVVGVAGSSGTTLAAALIGHLLRLHGLRTGVSSEAGIDLEGRALRPKADSLWQGGRDLLLQRDLDAAVIATSVHDIVTHGLPYDLCQVGVVTSIDPADTVPDYWILDDDDVFRVLRTQVDVVLASGAAVLDADSPAVAEMAPLSPGEVIFFSRRPGSAAIAEHIERGGRAVTLTERGVIMVSAGTTREILFWPHRIARLRRGDTAAEVAVLASVGAAIALDLPLSTLRTGLETFEPPRPDHDDALAGTASWISNVSGPSEARISGPAARPSRSSLG